MKNRPIKHKEKNVFKFKTFSERISDVDIRKSALYHIEHANEEETDETETQFHQCYRRWIGLNLTEEFAIFQKDISRIVTLPQLIHKKDFVVEHLLKFIQNATNLSLQPLLDFVNCLSKDLRDEFYPYFTRFLDVLIQILLTTKDPEQLEWTLICLAFLFKNLKPFLKKDVTIIFNQILPLLDENRPVHITNFAAECFSFVVRDIRDKQRFLEIVLRLLKRNNRAAVVGCGRLFSEIVRGMNGKLHSCAESFFTIFFDNFANEKLDSELLFEVLTQMVTDVLECIETEHLDVFWQTFFKCLGEFEKKFPEGDPVTVEPPVEYMLRLLGQVIEHENGENVTDSNAVINALVKVTDLELTERVALVVAQISSVILVSSNISVTQLDSSRLVRKILSTSHKKVFEEFVWNTTSYTQFEMLIFPEFLKYFDKYYSMECMQLLFKIIVKKAGLIKDGIHLETWKPFNITFKSSSNCLPKIDGIINQVTGIDDVHDDFIMAIVFYTHLMGVGKTHIVVKITELSEKILDRIAKDGSFDRKLIFLLSIFIEFLITSQAEINCIRMIKVLLPHANSIIILRLIDLLVSSHQFPEQLATPEMFTTIRECIGNNFTSPHHEVRLLSAHILMKFSSHIDQLKTVAEGNSDLSIYQIIYEVEKQSPTVHNYRELLQNLDKFVTTSIYFRTNLNESPLKIDALRYLLGCLYKNFKLLWEPVTKIIISYWKVLTPVELWEIISPALQLTETQLESMQKLGGKPTATVDDRPFGTDSLNDIYVKDSRIEDKPDYLNYRVLVLNVIANMETLSEVKNREFVMIFLHFLDSEYKKTDDEIRLTVNVTGRIQDDDNDDDDDEDNDDDDVEEDGKKNNATKNVSKTTKKRPHIAAQRTLIAYMKCFARMANPKSLHQEPMLSRFYYDLLSHKNFELQKLALDCLVAYKHKYLNPYKAHIYNLIDEKTFKDELLAFKIDTSTTGAIAIEHRDNLLPIIFRILHSKLGMKMASKKGSGNVRKSMILRFLANCPPQEIFSFIRMSFEQLDDAFQGDDLIAMVDRVQETVNLRSVINPKNLQSALTLIEVVRDQLGGLMGVDFMQYMIRLLCGLGSTVQAVLAKNTIHGKEVESGYLSIFRSLRNLSQTIVAQIFEHFDTFEWRDTDIEAIFKVFVWPGLERLPENAIVSPTPLLKILIELSKNPRYHVLLAKYRDDDVTMTPLPYVIQTLVNPKTSVTVVGAIMEMIEQLLTLDIELTVADEKPLTPIKIAKCIPLQEDKIKAMQLSGRLNYGSALLLPYISDILEKMRSSLVRSKSRSLNRRDLNILSRITELVTDSDTSDQLLTLLFPILVRRANAPNTDEAAISQMITTLTNLMGNIDQPEKHIRSVAPLFEQIQHVGVRKILCQLIANIVSKCSGERREHLTILEDITNGLNALDQRWLEQPDYERRLDTLRRIGELRKDTQGVAIDVNLCLIIVYHCFYYLKYDKDLAIRDSASHHLKATVVAVVKKYHEAGDSNEVDYLVGNILLNLVRRTINDTNDMVRSEGIALLGELARECSKCHPVLKDLHRLTDRHDREIDFFDNLTHLQSHRHGRALLRFCTLAKTLEHPPNPRTLTQFILPLTSVYLLNERYSKKHGLIETAIQTIGAVCSVLPWFQYESVLKYYLGKLRTNVEYQKQIVRIVMSILDSFHFDLSRANVVVAELPKIEDIEEMTAATTKPDDETEDDTAADLDQMLNATEPSIVEDDTETVTATTTTTKVTEPRLTVLSTNAAKRLIETISRGILPTLNNAIVKLSSHDAAHKLNRKRKAGEIEEEDSLRVPIALAIVKLLQKLPDGMLDHNLPGIFLKISTFLKSHLKSIRMLARDILRKIMLTVGPSRLGILLNHLSSLLTRGFQCHVLSVTVHNVLEAMRDVFKAGDIDRILKPILKIALEDIFGKTGEEKEIDRLASKTPEAKPSNKSYMILNILAANITESCLLDLLVPFKEHLAKSQSRKVVFKIQESFQKIIHGLLDNKHITGEALMIFVYGVTSEGIPDLLPEPRKPQMTTTEKERLQRERPDIFLIAEPPKSRHGAVKKIVRTNNQANAHVLIEFGLDLLHLIMRRGKLSEAEGFIAYLDPMISILKRSIQSSHVRVSTFALRCLVTFWNQKLSIPSLEANIEEIVAEMFKILHKYAAVGMSTNDDNYHLVKIVFKGMMSILRFVAYDITEDQLCTLLLYVEQDLHSNEKQNFAFSLLKAILGKKLQATEIHAIMEKIGHISIQSESVSTREETRAIMSTFLMNYPLGKKIDSHLKFYVNQLNYEVISGRQSAIAMCTAVIKKFPLDVLSKHAGFLFVALAARLVNDEEADCRKMVANAIEVLIGRLEKLDRDQLFDIVILFLDSEKPAQREMAAQLCTRFVNVEEINFEKRIKIIFPKLVERLTYGDDDVSNGGKFVKMKSNGNDDDDDDDDVDIKSDDDAEDDDEEELFKQKLKDHQLIQIQNAILKILETCPDVLASTKYCEYVDELAYQSQTLLGYEHSWVRLNSAKILDSIMATTNFSRVESTLLERKDRGVYIEDDRNFIYGNPRADLKSLVLDHCAQLFPGATDSEMAEQVMKNLLYVANILKNIPLTKSPTENSDDENDDDELSKGPKSKPINMIWLLRRVRFAINAEVAKAPLDITIRTACFNWIGGLVLILNAEIVKVIAPLIVAPLVREMSEDDTTVDPKLRQHANKIGNRIKKRIGEDEYNLLRSKSQSNLMVKRADRKRVLAQEKVKNPEKAANRKLGIQHRKKVAKKRRMDVVKGRAVPSRKKRKRDDDFA